MTVAVSSSYLSLIHVKLSMEANMQEFAEPVDDFSQENNM